MNRWKHGKNVIIFGVDMSSYVHSDNKNKDILVRLVAPKQGLDDTKLTAEAKYLTNFTHDGNSSSLFVNASPIYWFKEKDSEIKDYTLYLSNISKDFTTDSMKKQLKRKCNLFVVFNPIDTS